MRETVKKVLFINSEMAPFLPDSQIVTICRNLPQGIQERKKEIRSFMPKYGCINERRNQLHEVIRLSGMNIIISDVDRPLIIKVASISSARLQVYFLDNDDYFRRKQTDRDDEGRFFADNDERAIFFARGILETVKKLRWAPDIIHCHGWISQLVPLYLKRCYKDDPIFTDSKVVLSLYGDALDESFNPKFRKKIIAGGVSEDDLKTFAAPDGINLAKTAIAYSDAVIFASQEAQDKLGAFCGELPVLPYDGKALEDGSYIGEYDRFYDRL